MKQVGKIKYVCDLQFLCSKLILQALITYVDV